MNPAPLAGAPAVAAPGASPPARKGPLPALALAHGQTGPLLAGLLPWLAEGRHVYCLDGGNCFNPYALATQARAQGLDPTPLLERIFVSRAYTCYQLLEVVKTMLAPLAQQPDPPLAIILGMDTLFLEDELGLEERRRIYGRLVARAADLARRGLPLLITVLNAEWGMRNAELKDFYAPLRIVHPQAAADPPEAAGSLETFPHSAFCIPQFQVAGTGHAVDTSFHVWKEG